MVNLVRYDEACRAISAAKMVDEAKAIIDKAAAMQAYAKQAKNKEAEVDMAEIRMRARRRLGELILAQKATIGLAKGGQPYQSTGVKSEPVAPTLAQAGIDKKLSSQAQKEAAVPDEKFEAMLGDWRERIATENERVSTNLLRAGERAEYNAAKAERETVPADFPNRGDRYDIRVSDVSDLDWIEDSSVDCIITDPPYPAEFLPVYSALSKTAARILRPGGSCLVMIGQSYLPEVVQRLGEFLKYQWCLAYLTPGQAPQIWQRKVNTFWKPVLWFVNGEYEGHWLGDVAKSDMNDKRFHHWGQSESGIADLMRRVSRAGDKICDPFLGGGTTALVAIDQDRKFLGSDIDATAVETTLERLGHAASPI